MDNQEIRTLKILEEIENGHSPSQRYLAGQLNISLGLVNSFMKRLVNKGYFKITNIPAKRFKYILTPKGVAEKSRLTYQYIQYSFQFYKESRKRLHGIFKDLARAEVRRIIFFCASDLAEIAFLSMQEFDLELVSVGDDDKAGESFLGGTIVNSQMLESFSYDCLLITCVSNVHKAIDQLKELGVNSRQIVTLAGTGQ